MVHAVCLVWSGVLTCRAQWIYSWAPECFISFYNAETWLFTSEADNNINACKRCILSPSVTVSLYVYLSYFAHCVCGPSRLRGGVSEMSLTLTQQVDQLSMQTTWFLLEMLEQSLLSRHSSTFSSYRGKTLWEKSVSSLLLSDIINLTFYFYSLKEMSAYILYYCYQQSYGNIKTNDDVEHFNVVAGHIGDNFS